MKKEHIEAFELLEKVRSEKPLVHHLTNWVTIYDCANIVKVMGASPIMAHAPEEVAQMSGIAHALVLNIGTLTVEFVEAMKLAAKSANKKGIPVVLDVCGAGASRLRDTSSYALLDQCRIDVLKGNSSEIARIAGKDVQTKGVDASRVEADLKQLAVQLALERRCTVVITGKEDIVSDGTKTCVVRNGDPMMANIVGTGCMATSAIAVFCAVEKDLSKACCAGLVCFEIAAECAARKSRGPGTFKEQLYDCLYALDKKTVDTMQRVYCITEGKAKD